MFEVTIAYVAVILVLSTLVTALLEVFKRFLFVRGWWFQWAMRSAFRSLGVTDRAQRDRLWDAFHTDPFINPGRRIRMDRVSDAALRYFVTHLSDHLGDPKYTLPEWCEDEDLFGVWVANFNDAFGRGYKTVMFGLAFALGWGLAVGVGIDGVGMARHLRENPDASAWLTDLADPDSDAIEHAGGAGLKYLALFQDELSRDLSCVEGAQDACDERRLALLSEAREASKDQEAWERIADAVQQHFFTMRLARERDGEPAHWLATARGLAPDIAELPESQADRWLSAATLKAVEAFRNDDVALDDADFRAHLWGLCRATAADDASVMGARDCYLNWLDHGQASDECAACTQAMDAELDRVIVHTQERSWRDTAQARFDANEGSVAAHVWMAGVLETLTQPAQLTVALDSPAITREALIDIGALKQAEAAAVGARRRVELMTRDHVGFAGIWLAESLWQRLLGYLIIATLVAMGAPFWFDVLRRVQGARDLAEPAQPDEDGEQPVVPSG